MVGAQDEEMSAEQRHNEDLLRSCMLPLLRLVAVDPRYLNRELPQESAAVAFFVLAQLSHKTFVFFIWRKSTTKFQCEPCDLTIRISLVDNGEMGLQCFTRQ